MRSFIWVINMKIGNIELKNNIALAPLAGYTNLAYRKIMKEFGVGLVYTEMISAKGLLYENDKTWELTNIDENEHPVAVQIFGGEIEDMIKATKLLDERSDCDIIDINMGCPVKKVLKSNAGSYLLLDSDKVYEMVKAVVSNTSKVVTVKIRAGWDHKSINCVEVAKKIEEAGAKMIAIHGRTKSDLYSGKVNLDYIKMVKESVNIPVFGNGDIKTVDDAIKMIEYTGVDGVMLARGTFGNPWLVRDLVDYMEGRPLQVSPTKQEKVEMLKHHFEELLKIKCEKLAVLEMRTLAAWYVKGFSNAKEFKNKLIYVKTKEELMSLIENL